MYKLSHGPPIQLGWEHFGQEPFLVDLRMKSVDLQNVANSYLLHCESVNCERNRTNGRHKTEPAKLRSTEKRAEELYKQSGGTRHGVLRRIAKENINRLDDVKRYLCSFPSEMSKRKFLLACLFSISGTIVCDKCEYTIRHCTTPASPYLSVSLESVFHLVKQALSGLRK